MRSSIPALQTAVAAGLLIPGLLSTEAEASSVLLETSLGNIVIDLLEEEAPLTVENFLGYVERGDYDGTIFHRSVPGFVVQGGGFVPGEGDTPPVEVPTLDPVVNEPDVSNTRGTVALARTSEVDSGTNQFFFNLSDNSQNLDNQNEGFTVFARVTEGLDIVDAIAALDTVNGGGAFTDLPFLGDTTPGAFDEVDFVLLNTASVVADAVVEEVVEDVIEEDVVEEQVAGPVVIDPIDEDVVVPVAEEASADEPTTVAVPSPTALAAGLLGLSAMTARRRRDR